MGARGGVGSTTVACNTAWTLADMTKEETILVDLDLNFAPRPCRSISIPSNRWVTRCWIPSGSTTLWSSAS